MKWLLYFLITLTASLFPIGACMAKQLGRNPVVAKAPIAKTPFQLEAQPAQLVGHYRKPLNLSVVLTDTTDHDVVIRVCFIPCPFNVPVGLQCLRMRCRDLKTGREVRYRWPPPIETVADVQLKESALTIPIDPSRPYVVPFNLSERCVLPPGQYALDLQYDTRHTPAGIKPDPRAWHGVTNKVTVNIRILK
jgi:hypothetical protein